MEHLDLRVVERALQWAHEGASVWFATVLDTYGSAPRSPGALLVARDGGDYLGSLSGGCVEERFIEQLAEGEFERPATLIRYGERADERERLRLPCGGVLEVLVEHRSADDEWITHLEVLHAALLGRQPMLRRVELDSGRYRLRLDHALGETAWVEQRDTAQAAAMVRIGPALRLVLAGLSPVAEYCVEFARALGFEVIVCEPRERERLAFAARAKAEGIELQAVWPALFVASGACHAATAVVATTHDPRLDDPAMVEAVRTEAFYVGVMGSKASSRSRAERLARSGGLTQAQIGRIHMPIGLDLGSRRPAEIALSIVADVLRVHRGVAQ
ncbi:XdhC family protein [Halotalea alkalilenta]|uniref:XdhC family protein n=1 Tax=Halotalea alkalilenta TaxID=376489 RepID=UPI00048325D2|nr:XdhC family protein [Halotalea alkalilenta]